MWHIVLFFLYFSWRERYIFVHHNKAWFNTKIVPCNILFSLFSYQIHEIFSTVHIKLFPIFLNIHPTLMLLVLIDLREKLTNILENNTRECPCGSECYETNFSHDYYYYCASKIWTMYADSYVVHTFILSSVPFLDFLIIQILYSYLVLYWKSVQLW